MLPPQFSQSFAILCKILISYSFVEIDICWPRISLAEFGIEGGWQELCNGQTLPKRLKSK